LTTPARRGEGSDKDTTGAELQRTIGNTVKYMDSRFKNLFEKPLSCFKVFDPSSLPLSRDELANYGDEKVDYLVKHFASLLNEEEKEKIPQEWMDLKMWLSEHRVSSKTACTRIFSLRIQNTSLIFCCW